LPAESWEMVSAPRVRVVGAAADVGGTAVVGAAKDKADGLAVPA